MPILDLLGHPATNVPIEYGGETGFREMMFAKLDNFYKLVQESPDVDSQIHPFFLNISDYKTKIGQLVSGLKQAINKFYEGKPAKAYDTFSRTMTSLNISEYLDKQSILPSNTNFFRLRTAPGNYPLSREGLFHVPFEKRGLVQSQRFSIPGLPSLYTANSIYVSWEEMRRPNLDSIQAIRLVSRRNLRLLDITTDVYSAPPQFHPDRDSFDLLYKVLTWPLAACCSVKVKNHTDTFKPEYIIPQLLLQWTNVNLDGIKYSSSHIDLNKTSHIGKFYNVVLPVKTFDQDAGYCPRLRETFLATGVLPMQLRQLASTTDRFYDQPSINVNVNEYIEELALIEGTSQLYSQTSFGVLEHALNGLQATEFT